MHKIRSLAIVGITAIAFVLASCSPAAPGASEGPTVETCQDFVSLALDERAEYLDGAFPDAGVSSDEVAEACIGASEKDFTTAVDDAIQAQHTPESSATPSAPPAAKGATARGSVTTADGYSYTVDVNVEFGTPTSDATNAKPGSTDVQVPAKLTITVKNTTPGNHALPQAWFGAPSSAGTIEIRQRFAPGTAVCSIQTACYIVLAKVPTREQVGAGATVTYEFGSLDDGLVYLTGVPEASAQAVMTQLVENTEFAVSSEYWAGSQGACVFIIEPGMSVSAQDKILAASSNRPCDEWISMTRINGTLL